MPNRNIKIGNTGDDVKDAQGRLAHLGFLVDAGVDGKFGPQTARAVIAFQHANKLPEDGMFSPEMWRLLTDATPTSTVPDKGTAGPAAEDHPSVVSPDGWWSGATRVPAFAGRVGPAIRPRTIVVHTTDTLEGSTSAIVRSWSTTAGKGDCAHFIIARDGVVTQMVPIYRNGNHAGGPIHGNYKSKGALVHPNVWAVGIEIEAGGRLRKKTAQGWIHPDTKKVLSDDVVSVDAKGIGWHKVTDAQLAALETVLSAVEGELSGLDPDTTIVPDGTYKENGVDYFAEGTTKIAGHVTLDPVNKTDPGPFVMAWLAQRAKSHA